MNKTKTQLNRMSEYTLSERYDALYRMLKILDDYRHVFNNDVNDEKLTFLIKTEMNLIEEIIDYRERKCL